MKRYKMATLAFVSVVAVAAYALDVSDLGWAAASLRVALVVGVVAVLFGVELMFRWLFRGK